MSFRKWDRSKNRPARVGSALLAASWSAILGTAILGGVVWSASPASICMAQAEPVLPASSPAANQPTGPSPDESSSPPAGPALTYPSAPSVAATAIQPDPTGQPPVRLTLEDALQIALRENPSVASTEDRIDRARSHVDEIRSAVEPQVNGIGTYTWQGPIASFTLPGQPGQPPQTIRLATPTSKTLVFGARKLMDFSGQNRISRDIARKGITSAELDLATAQNNLLLSVYNDFYQVLRADQFVNVEQEAVSDAQEQERVAEAQFRAGTSAQFDVLRAAVQVENLRQQLVTAQKNASLARATLLNTLGADPQTSIDVVPVALPAPPAAIPLASPGPSQAAPQSPASPPSSPSPAPPATPSNGSGKAVTPDNGGATEGLPLDLSTAVREAYVSRPEVQNAATAVRIAERNVDLARRGMRPDVTLNGQYLYNPDVTGFSTFKGSWSVNAQLNIPIFDGGATRARVAESRDDVNSARAGLSQAQQAVALEVRSTLLDLQEASRRRQSTAANVVQAREAVRIAQVRFKAGVSTTVEVTDAQVALTQAETDEVNADYDYLDAEAHLRKAIGRLVPGSTAQEVASRPGPPPTPEAMMTPRRGEKPAPDSGIAPPR